MTDPTLTRNEEARRRRVAVALGNPAWFGEYYVRPYDENWTGPLPRLAGEMLAFCKNVRRGVLMTPPEFLKTTMVSQVYPLWVTCRYAAAGKLAQLRGALMSEMQELAERNLSVVAWHIENNPRIRADFVDLSGQPLLEPDPDENKWTDDAIIVRRPGVSKDPTWQAKGVKTTIQGARLNVLVGDDLVTPGSAKSVAKQKDALHRWDHEVTTRLVEGGQAIVAGNFNHAKDLVSTIAGRNSYVLMKRPALHVPGDRSKAPENPRDPAAVPALPEKWSRERLLGELADKPASFNTVYLLRSGSEKGGSLRVGWVSKITLEDVPRLERVYLIGVDPAPGADVDPDPSFFSYAVGVLTPTNLDVIESYAARMETTEQVELIADVVKRYRRLGHVGGIAVAKIALDRYWKGSVLVGHPELRPLLSEVSIPGDKTERLTYLGPYFKSGWARITETAWSNQTADPDDQAQDETFGEQWTALPNQNHDDRLDAVDVLIREALERGVTVQKTVVGAGTPQQGQNGRQGPGHGVTGDLLDKPM